MKAAIDTQVREVLKHLDQLIETQGTESLRAFGTFGCIVRLNDEFEILRTWASKKRRRAVTKEVRDALKRIAGMALVASAIETEGLP